MSDSKPSVMDFLPEFVNALEKSLEGGQEKWGNTWLHRPYKGQEVRIRQYINDMFDQNLYADQPIRWESIAGQALIGWIRENHPELFLG